jgi:hypothetical protein
VRYYTGYFLGPPIVSGATLWQLMAMIVAPRLMACLLSWMSPFGLAAAVLTMPEIPVRVVAIPPLTAIVLIRYAFVFKRVVATRAWDPMLPSVVDVIGVILGILWSITSIY